MNSPGWKTGSISTRTRGRSAGDNGCSTERALYRGCADAVNVDDQFGWLVFGGVFHGDDKLAVHLGDVIFVTVVGLYILLPA